jgi:hypothetical protein
MTRPACRCLLAVLALALVACGDDRMSAKEYRSAATRICVDSEKATDAIEQPTRSNTEAIVDYLQRLADASEDTIQRFEKLDPPEELSKPHRDILAANRDGQQTVRKVIADLRGGDEAREVLQASTARLRALGQRVNAAAKKLGLDECVQ